MKAKKDPFAKWRKPEEKKRKKDNPTKTPIFKDKIHIPFLRKGKRYLAMIVLLLNGVFGVGSITSSNTQMLALFFFVNFFICADYLWKTSGWRFTRE